MNNQLREILSQVEEVLNTGDAQTALALCEQALKVFPNSPEALFTRAISLQLNGRLEEALDSYHIAALADPSFTEAWNHLALLAIELLEWKKAEHALQRAIRSSPLQADGWWIRSLLRELNGDINGAKRTRAHASWLNPEAYPPLPYLKDEDLIKIAHVAMEYLPEISRDFLLQLPIHIEDYPSRSFLQHFVDPPSPLRLLCHLNNGHGREGTQNPMFITLFRQNIRRAFQEDELLNDIRQTLLFALEDIQENSPTA